MVEPAGAPQPQASTSTKTNSWVMIVAILVVLCCACIGAIGLLFAFGEPILNELGLIQAWLPAQVI